MIHRAIPSRSIPFESSIRKAALWLATASMLTCLLSLASTINAAAQDDAPPTEPPQEQDADSPTAIQEFADQYNERFLNRDPQLGEKIPDDLIVYDEEGEPFELRKLQGKHSVIVFGCLT